MINNWYKIASEENKLQDAIIKKLGKEKGILLYNDVKKELDQLNVQYRFEGISALGCAKNDVLILSNSLLNFSMPNLLFVLFHELTHYYQYRKYGDDFALSIYINSEEKIKEDAQRLLQIERTADKFSQLKSSYYLKKHSINESCTVSGYRHLTAEYLATSILQIKRTAKKMGLTTIKDINEFIYNLVSNPRILMTFVR